MSLNGGNSPNPARFRDRALPPVTASPQFRTPLASGTPALRFRERVSARVGTVELLVFRIANERFGVDFARTITSIESDIAEREERTRDDDDEGGGFSRGSDPSPANLVTEDDVREMFKTLRE